MITLNVVPAHGPPFEYRPEGEEQVIGRSSKADLVIADRSLSRQHARLLHRDERWLIEDLGSRNGTHVNRAPITEATALHDGDVIGLGASTVTVRQVGGAEARVGDSDSFGEHTLFRPASELLESSDLQPTTRTMLQALQGQALANLGDTEGALSVLDFAASGGSTNRWAQEASLRASLIRIREAQDPSEITETIPALERARQSPSAGVRDTATRMSRSAVLFGEFNLAWESRGRPGLSGRSSASTRAPRGRTSRRRSKRPIRLSELSRLSPTRWASSSSPF